MGVMRAIGNAIGEMHSKNAEKTIQNNRSKYRKTLKKIDKLYYNEAEKYGKKSDIEGVCKLRNKFVALAAKAEDITGDIEGPIMDSEGYATGYMPFVRMIWRHYIKGRDETPVTDESGLTEKETSDMVPGWGTPGPIKYKFAIKYHNALKSIQRLYYDRAVEYGKEANLKDVCKLRDDFVKLATQARQIGGEINGNFGGYLPYVRMIWKYYLKGMNDKDIQDADNLTEEDKKHMPLNWDRSGPLNNRYLKKYNDTIASINILYNKAKNYGKKSKIKDVLKLRNSFITLAKQANILEGDFYGNIGVGYMPYVRIIWQYYRSGQTDNQITDADMSRTQLTEDEKTGMPKNWKYKNIINKPIFE